MVKILLGDNQHYQKINSC